MHAAPNAENDEPGGDQGQDTRDEEGVIGGESRDDNAGKQGAEHD